MYGLMLLLAIAACVGLTGLRYVRRGGDWDLVLRVAVWGVAAGIVGARLYHDVTSWNEVPDPKWKGIFEVWKGGLGVWGGILFGSIAGAIVVRRSGRSVRRVCGCGRARAAARAGHRPARQLVQPGAVRQADRPAVGARDRPSAPCSGYEDHSTFQPTFLYELIYDLSMVGVLLLIDWRFRIRAPALFALYVSLYTFGRFFEELLRIDPRTSSPGCG